VKRAYAPFLEVAIDNRWVMLSGALALLIVAFGMIRSGITPFTIFPKVDSKRIQARVMFPDGTPVSVTEDAVARIERALDDTAAKLGAGGRPLVTLVNASIGAIDLEGKPGVSSTSSGSRCFVARNRRSSAATPAPARST
jgi:multidrug efflux pump subunit AcrB